MYTCSFELTASIDIDTRFIGNWKVFTLILDMLEHGNSNCIRLIAAYNLCQTKFGVGVPIKGGREYVHVGSMTESMLPKPLPNTPTPPYANAEI